MKKLLPQILRYSSILISSLLFSSCTSFMDLSQDQLAKIRFGCSSKCTSIVLNSNPQQQPLSRRQKARIRAFLRHSPRHGNILVSECDPNFDHNLTRQISAYILHRKYRPIRVRPTLPYHHLHTRCVNLVRGPITMYPPHCSLQTATISTPSYSRLIGHNFGCATQYNLAQMIRDPNDFFIRSGVEGDIK